MITEIFVLIVFIAGLLFLVPVLKETELPGRKMFFIALFILLLSNIFTVVEEFIFNEFFNLLEHFSIFLGSLFIMAGAFKMLGGRSGE